MQQCRVGTAHVVALEEHSGCPFALRISADASPMAQFDFQQKDRSLELTHAELKDLAAAASGLIRMLDEDQRKYGGQVSVAMLTRETILRTAKNFSWDRMMPKWTVIVDGIELPARPLVLEAAGVPPNDPTNSHRAVAKLKSLGFDTRYQGKSV